MTKILGTLMLFALAVCLEAQQRDFTGLRFQSLNEKAGSQFGQINSIAQGPSGFIWFGTSQGAHRYDGYDIVSYQTDSKNPRSLINSTVWSLFLDSRRELWIGTQKGISRFVPEYDSFANYILNPIDMNNNLNNRCNAIVEDSRGRIYASAEDGSIYRYDPEADRFQPIVSSRFGTIKSMAFDSQDTLWVGSDSALYSFEPESLNTRKYEEGLAPPDGAAKNFVYSLLPDRARGTVWVASSYHGVTLTDVETGSASELPFRLPSSRVHKLYSQGNSQIWACHGGGATLFDKDGTRIIDYPPNARDDYLPNGSTRCMLIDDQNNLWIGTYRHGLYLSSNNKQFDTYIPKNRNSRPGNRPVVSSILRDSQQRLWIGYNNSGIDVIDRAGELLFTLQKNPEDPNSIGAYAVYSIFEDSSGTVWVGTYNGGLQKFNEERRNFKTYRHDPDDPASIGGNDCRAIAEDSSGNLWIAVKGAGISRFDPKSETFETYRYNPENTAQSLLDDWPSDIAVGPSGRIYVATPIGLSILDPETNTFTSLTPNDSTDSLSNASCQTLFFDSKDRLWIGTKNGLNLYRPANDTFTRFLEGYQSLAIAEDRNANLWVGTDKGLAHLVRATGKAKLYDTLDGIVHDAFMNSAVATWEDGVINFGQNGGLTVFEPESIKDNTEPPPVFITDLKVFFESLAIDPENEQSSPLSKTIQETESVTLGYDQKVLTIQFVAKNYIQTEKNQYKYKLEGFDKDWNNVGTRREAYYTNLDPGTYTFRVLASNNDGYWNEEGASLQIIITPPFWQRTWFIATVAVLIIAAIVAVIRKRERRLKAEQQRLENLVEKRTHLINEKNDELAAQSEQLIQQRDELAQHKDLLEERVKERTQKLEAAMRRAEQSDQLKSSFLANLSHEIRTPLNAIVGFSKLLQIADAEEDDYDDYIPIIIENSDSLLQLIDDILDFSLIESNQLKIEKADFQLSELLGNLAQTHSVQASKKGLALSFENLLPSNELTIHSDRNRIKQIVVNFLTNALKFTDKGSVTLRAQIVEEELRISVCDTGNGIHPEHQKAIFERFYKLKADDDMARRGVGLGLAISQSLTQLLGGRIELESVPGSGSCFELVLPAPPDAVSKPGPNPEETQDLSIEDFEKGILDGLHVLVVEDEEPNYLFLKAALKRVGATCFWAENGPAAVNAVDSQQPFDMILLDIKMPGMDGFQVHELLRHKGCELPIIAQTAFAQREDEERIREAKFSDYISKPIDRLRLYRKLAYWNQKKLKSLANTP